MPQVPTVMTREIETGERNDIMLLAETAQSVAATKNYLDDFKGKVLGEVETEIGIA